MMNRYDEVIVILVRCNFTATESPSDQSHGNNIARLRICVTIRSNGLVEQPAPGNRESDVDTVNPTQNPKVHILNQC